MESQIQKMPLNENKSNRQNKSCENCKKLYRKIDHLQETVNNLTQKGEQQNEAIMSALAEIKVVTSKLLRQDTSITAAANGFPISSTIMLQNLEDKITSDNRDIYISTMSKLWRNCVGKNLETILDAEIVMSHNIDGSHGKHSLKKYTNFYKALIDSIITLPSLGQKDPEQALRQAMQLCKKKQFRQQSSSAKKPHEVPSGAIGSD